VPYDGGRDHEQQARIALEGAAAALKRWPRLEILHGRPAQALLDQAALEGYGLLVIGTKGAGATRSVLGSTATELARTARIPVLMVGAGEEPVAELPARHSRAVPRR
jgi:nucleotide-binding universal stress UspA family protein